jgi:hypothetical protein
MVKREARRSCVLAESRRGEAVVECNAGDGTAALLPLLALAERRRRAKRNVQNVKGGARLGVKACARAGATGCHPAKGVAGVRPHSGEALLLVGRESGARERGAGQTASVVGRKGWGRSNMKMKFLFFFFSKQTAQKL